MQRKNWKQEVLTLPNALSLLRIALIPVYIRLYHHSPGERANLLAGSVLVLSCLTDLVDGKIAREWNMVSELGKILDPLADKLTQLVLILSLSARHTALYPVLALFLCKELFQCAALVCFARQGKALAGALFAGKLCTTVLFVSLILLVLFPSLPRAAVVLLTVLDSILLLYSFGSYLLAYFGRQPKLRQLGSE